MGGAFSRCCCCCCFKERCRYAGYRMPDDIPEAGEMTVLAAPNTEQPEADHDQTSTSPESAPLVEDASTQVKKFAENSFEEDTVPKQPAGDEHPDNTNENAQGDDGVTKTSFNISNKGKVTIQLGRYNSENTHNSDGQNDGLLAKLYWDLDKEKERANKLQRKKKEKEAKCRRLEQELEKQRADSSHKCINEAAAVFERQMEEERRRSDERIAAIQQRFEQERDRMRRDFTMFTIEPSGANVRPSTSDAQVGRVANDLYRQLNVRLLGIEPGPSFILDTPMTQWAEVMRRQTEIQAILQTLLREHTPSDVTWGDVTSQLFDDIDLRLHSPIQEAARHPPNASAESNTNQEGNSISVNERPSETQDVRAGSKQPMTSEVAVQAFLSETQDVGVGSEQPVTRDVAVQVLSIVTTHDASVQLGPSSPPPLESRTSFKYK